MIIPLFSFIGWLEHGMVFHRDNTFLFYDGCWGSTAYWVGGAYIVNTSIEVSLVNSGSISPAGPANWEIGL